MRRFTQIHYRFFLLALADVAIISVGFALAFWLRLSGLPTVDAARFHEVYFATLPWLLVIRLICGLAVRQYSWAFRYASLPEAIAIVGAGLTGSVFFILLCEAWGTLTLRPPRSVYVLEFFFSLMGFGFIRFFPRYLFQARLRQTAPRTPTGEARVPTLIYGAGHTGELITRDLSHSNLYPYRLVGFIDDQPSRMNASIHGVRVLGTRTELPTLIDRHQIEMVIVAIPSLAAACLREVVEMCNEKHIRFKIAPDYAQALSRHNEAGVVALKDIQLEDLIERKSVNFDVAKAEALFTGKRILITGAAGSIGSELCRQLARQDISALIALDLNENDLYFLDLELRDIAPELSVSIVVASVREKDSLSRLFLLHRPDLVFHAAAHKHVPLMEAAPAEAIKNNILGTLYTAECAVACGAERFVLISTDKAVRPANIMGASKRLAEMVVRNLDCTGTTRFMAVRFGNVLGSNGSLVPILQRQIAKGGPVTITHPEVTRYFMSIPEAVGLVLAAAVQHEGFLSVLDMGEPVLIERLARTIIVLSGQVPDKDIKIVYTGLRPGEKLHEELFADSDTLQPSTHERIQLAQCSDALVPLATLLAAVKKVLADPTPEALHAFFTKYVPDYLPAAEANANHPPLPASLA